jgi:hypothetical protein
MLHSTAHLLLASDAEQLVLPCPLAGIFGHVQSLLANALEADSRYRTIGIAIRFMEISCKNPFSSDPSNIEGSNQQYSDVVRDPRE